MGSWGKDIGRSSYCSAIHSATGQITTSFTITSSQVFAKKSETNLPGSDSPGSGGSSLPTLTTAISQGAKLLRTRLNPCFGRKGSEFRWQMLAGIWMLDVICWVAPFCCSWRSGQHRDYSSDRQNVKICSAILKLLVWQDDQDGLKQHLRTFATEIKCGIPLATDRHTSVCWRGMSTSAVLA